MAANRQLPRVFRLAALLALLLLGPLPPAAVAQRAEQRAPAAEATRRQENSVVTRSFAPLNGAPLTYTVTTGTLPLSDSKGAPAADVFHIAYVAATPAGAERPVTFVFNGGPGAASAFLHLGALGPRTIHTVPDGAPAPETSTLADNPDTWLPFTDLVFIDPVGTGYSRTVSQAEDAERAFSGTAKDADAMTSFVRLWLARSGRLLSPTILVGESYGGFRAALMADRLLAAGIRLRGLVLISPALDFGLVRGGANSILPLALVLPSLAAAHIEIAGGRDASLAPLAEVEQFARTDYLVHLASGRHRNPTIESTLARFTGLDREQIARQHGRVPVPVFLRDHERRRDRQLSRYDATVDTAVPRPSRETRFDPGLDGAVAALTPLVGAYLRADLGYGTDLEYRMLNRALLSHWDFGTSPSRQGYASALDELQQARLRNPDLRILIANGYTDLVTTYMASRYMVDQLEPIEGARPITVKVYRGGHMMYLRAASRHALTEDARALYSDAAASAHGTE